MSKKVLKIKRLQAWSIYNNLKTTQPKDFPSTGEIKETIISIMPALKNELEDYINLLKKVEDANEQFMAKKIDEKERNEKIDKINDEFREYNKTHAEEICNIELQDESLKVLKGQFERDNWGKKWVNNLEEFGELLLAFEEASK